MRCRFTEAERCLALAIMYRQFQFRRDGGAAQPIGFGGFVYLTGLDRRGLIRAQQRLEDRHVITVDRLKTRSRNDRSRYRVNAPGQWSVDHYPDATTRGSATTIPGASPTITGGGPPTSAPSGPPTTTFNHGNHEEEKQGSSTASRKETDDDKRQRLAPMYAAREKLHPNGIFQPSAVRREPAG